MVYYEAILEKFKKLPVEKQIVKFFETVRDIPYGNYEPRSPENTWLHKKGTCSTKNLLLKDLCLAIGIPVQVWMCSYAMYSSKKFPDELNALLDTPIVVYHTFLKIEMHEQWVTVDATHDLGMKVIGATVVEHWDGKSDTPLAVKPIEYFQVNDVNEFKQQMNAKMTHQEQAKKVQAMQLFFAWVDAIRK